jgi:hypothetical protein
VEIIEGIDGFSFSHFRCAFLPAGSVLAGRRSPKANGSGIGKLHAVVERDSLVYVIFVRFVGEKDAILVKHL